MKGLCVWKQNKKNKIPDSWAPRMQKIKKK